MPSRESVLLDSIALTARRLLASSSALFDLPAAHLGSRRDKNTSSRPSAAAAASTPVPDDPPAPFRQPRRRRSMDVALDTWLGDGMMGDFGGSDVSVPDEWVVLEQSSSVSAAAADTLLTPGARRAANKSANLFPIMPAETMTGLQASVSGGGAQSSAELSDSLRLEMSQAAPTEEAVPGEAMSPHLQKMLAQLLEREGLDAVWEPVLVRLVHRVAALVRSNVRGGDNLDVRKYVRIKKLETGTPEGSAYFSGVVFSKNVAHKGMANSIMKPKIVMLQCGIEFHNGPIQFMSLDPVRKS